MATETHADRQELDDWAIYGPKDPEISRLVARLVLDHGLRVRDVEALILVILQEKIAAEEAR
ncbi:hypothetical protein QWZ10_07730 [Paracoccus cavernae]|uniref:Uncharacterized protein n=1 Tax=Paracoccus cavernae TaxID=1571207 RepID=A0ABT8D5G7_9RHOB|nr:hypothetical protein [Paracoccus cavernae]